MRNFIQNADTITVTAPANVASGDGVLVGDIFGIAAADALSGAEVEIKTTGAYSHGKISAQAWTVGLALYWDATGKVLTSTASTNKLVGVALAVAANPSATGIVRLNGVFGVPSAAQMAAGDV